METKICSKCKIEKDVSEFSKEKMHYLGVHSICKACLKIIKRTWQHANKEKCKLYSQKYRNANIKQCNIRSKANMAKRRATDKEQCFAYANSWRQANKEKISGYGKNYRAKNIEMIKARKKKYYIANKEKIHRRQRDMRRENPQKRLNNNMSRLINRSFKTGESNGSKWAILPYTLNELKKHLEKQFTKEMNWKNYGSFWSLDHIIPISVFNFNTPDQIDFKRCWALKNLQPLLTKDNLIKGAKLEHHFQPSLLI